MLKDPQVLYPSLPLLMVTDLELSQAQFLSSILYLKCLIASASTPSVTPQDALNVVEDVKQIIIALGNLTNDVGLLKSRVDDLQLIVSSSHANSSGKHFTLITEVSEIKAYLLANNISIAFLQQFFDKHVVDVQAHLSSLDALLNEILSLLQQPQVHPPSFTPKDREALVMAIDFVVLQNTTISNVEN
ncbi:hypothetical protein L6452_08999 [Arctium lappa]|uniref:Uncharacterized protein n=1 Tax=Arctium lappa TaxID=4217 RepID=A0ACB9DJ63_ARCLA|nr:hypothetical protein L6452_08999 [Arctium lappa]